MKRFPNVKFEADPAKLRNPTLAFLRDYWEQKRGGRALPSRADIKPSELKHHLGWIVIVDVLPGAADFRYRLVGSLITEYFGIEATGKTVREVWAPNGEGGVEGSLAVFRYVVEKKVVLRAFGDDDWNTIGLENFDCLYLPLSNDGERVNVILHAFVFDRPEVLLARQIARANGNQLLIVPKQQAGTR
jgi:hypothetical protein